jgi:tRNA(Arg) A34 adenosine deaminase TadA
MADEDRFPDDDALMQTALDQAREAALAGEAPIGALIFDPSSKTIVTAQRNSPIALHDPCAHAEILALRAAGQKLGNYRLTGLWLYVTLEPCAMCAGAISHARIGRLIYGADDAKGGAVAHGPRFFAQPTCHWRPEVASGVLAEDSAALLRDFFRARRKKGSNAAPDEV